MPIEDSKPVVFISYSHDSEEHRTRVRGLGASLARDGCDCRLDVHKDTDEDWPSWMKRQLREADFVLCVSTQTYERRFDDQELPDVGQGVGWEAGLIRRLLYQKKLHNDRIFPIYFEATDRQHIPLELHGFDHFHLDGQAAYENLLRKVHHRPHYAKPSPGPIPDLPTQASNPHFARPDSIDTAESILAGEVASLCAAMGIKLSRSGPPGPPAARVLDAETLGRLRDLLVALPGWSNARKRRNFVRFALWEHRVLGEVDLDGPPVDVAADLVQRCIELDEPTDSGLSPLCALLAAVPRELGSKPARDLEIAALSALLECCGKTG